MDLNDAILKLLAESGETMSLAEVQARLEREWPDLHRRTLQRAIAELVETGRVSRLGAGPSTTYGASAPETPDDTDSIALSDAARRQLDYLALPILKRTPVTYRPAPTVNVDASVAYPCCRCI